MPVISMACPKCGKQATEYDENKWQCLHCGRKFIYKDEKAPVINVNQILRTGDSMQSVLCCPKCGNTNVQLKQMVYEAGTQTSSGDAVGVTTLLANRCKPPENTAIGVVLLIGISVVVIYICFSYGQWLAAGLPLLLAIFLVKVALSAYDRYKMNLRRWSEIAICLTCGEEFPMPKDQPNVAVETKALETPKQLESSRNITHWVAPRSPRMRHRQLTGTSALAAPNTGQYRRKH